MRKVSKIIQDCPLPVEMVQEAIDYAAEKLPTVMTFTTENCMSTKSLVLLKLSQSVQEWSVSDDPNAPSPEQAKSFATGCHSIISEDTSLFGYGVLNNSTIQDEMKLMLEHKASIDEALSNEEQVISKDSSDPKI